MIESNIQHIKYGSRILIASHNKAKIREMKTMMAPYNIRVISSADLDLPEPEETGDSFNANAEIKAVAAAKASGMISLADDSGFCVNALKGAPGIYSARWAGPNKDYKAAMERIREELGHNKDWSAWFFCALCVVWPDGTIRSFDGRVDGEFVWPPRGKNGHGYDPVFKATGSSLTFGEMTDAEKNEISHRARAFNSFYKNCLLSSPA
ncbi:MAG: RdgB/HAM1 family non-canonical purine NTP pyrophosphatase [Commensalibacter sp.]|nr:RdgB/HAM1 family non-canonical purine NTP pyrophosphatase [Commensalibacter sp.]